ncbi:hypothetical protein [Flavobacterium covae]|uniref:hypothetical protein n=1 Tax=Flavobacterium covae TaxID=2906076 RepID=UPI000745E488|nr:hypothetical protein [Flavobacterium covae]AMA50438.1 hypothetical protein AWN65_13705 [Flavobacterium covae]MCJ1809085.1 hypothetical protein [Flavobacterium covae]
MGEKINAYSTLVDMVNETIKEKKIINLAYPNDVFQFAIKSKEIIQGVNSNITQNGETINPSPILKEAIKQKEIYQVSGSIKKMFDDFITPSLIYKRMFNWHEEIKRNSLEFEKQQKELKEYWVYNLMVKELETIKQQLEEKTKELEDFKADFRKFYERSKPSLPIQEKQPIEVGNYSLECELNKFEIISLYEKFIKEIFDCSIDDAMNLLSEKITTKIKVKDNVKLIDTIAFFKALYDLKIIKTAQWANVIDKTECIIFNNKYIKSKQIKDAKKQLKMSFKDIDIKNAIEDNIKK